LITRRRSFEIRLLSALLLTLLCLGCTSPATPGSGQSAATLQSAAKLQSPANWQSPLHQDHALVGKIWLPAENQFISRDGLLLRLASHPLLLLGEKHDNPDHHRLRLELLKDLISPDSNSLLVLEMMTRDQQPAIERLTGTSLPTESDSLVSQLAWDTDGWPWQFYGPAVMLAFERDVQLRAGNINTGDVMQIYQDDTPHNSQPLNTEQIAQLERDIDSSHCGMLPSSQFPAMVRVQQTRDQQMSTALLPGDDVFDQRILLAGNYHIRHDLGVPNYLSQRPLSVAFLEVDPEYTAPAPYSQAFSETLPYDVIWFTPALRQNDYCADMRATQAR
jgi:uncharacterized iron-regulated protein